MKEKKRSKAFKKNLRQYVSRVMDHLWKYKVKGWEIVLEVYNELFETYQSPNDRAYERELIREGWSWSSVI